MLSLTNLLAQNVELGDDVYVRGRSGLSRLLNQLNYHAVDLRYIPYLIYTFAASVSIRGNSLVEVVQYQIIQSIMEARNCSIYSPPVVKQVVKKITCPLNPRINLTFIRFQHLPHGLHGDRISLLMPNVRKLAQNTQCVSAHRLEVFLVRAWSCVLV